MVAENWQAIRELKLGCLWDTDACRWALPPSAHRLFLCAPPLYPEQMEIEWVRSHCLSFAHATEHVQWGNDLVFKVAGKMFAVMALEPGQHWLSFKCSNDGFAELVERPDIVPAPYLAKAQWVALQSQDALSRKELKQRLREAYEIVWAKLPKKAVAELESRAPNRKSPRGV